MRKPSGSRAQQYGAATLLVSMVLLIAATLLVLYASNTVVGEQRMSANEVRSKQAFEAAAAGIELTIQQINASEDDIDFNAAAQTALNISWTPTNSSFSVLFCEPTTFDLANLPHCGDSADDGITAASCTTPGASAKTAWAVSCGWSDDSAARKRILTLVAKTDPVPVDISNPLIANGSVGMSGNATVVNYFNNLTVWTGSTLDNTGNTGKTVIRRPGMTNATSGCAGGAGACTSQEVTDQVGGGDQVCTQAEDLICTTSTGVFGPDVIQSDTTLANLTGDQYFENFLGMKPNEYKSTQAEEVVVGAHAGSIGDGEADNGGGTVFWVEGNAAINQDIGSANKPVVLVVDGDLDLSGSPTIFGIVFVRGNLTQSGSATIRGAALITGSVDADGSLNVIYDPDAIGGGKCWKLCLTAGKLARFLSLRNIFDR
ncbi:PilX N-terminal domain-containing pilus assembly protein [Azoarcus sp. PA01]|nr:PilX N-terminal domain-containing pilus assembly protein [Azoarcus sp. PA01]